MRVLVAGWFSLDAGATAGDLLVRDVVCGWLAEAGIDHDVALGAPYDGGVSWFRVAPERYTHVVIACGPVTGGMEIGAIVRRFDRCRLVALNTSMVGDPGWRPFDTVIARDGEPGAAPRPDLALIAPAAAVPVVARIEAHRQVEYAAPRPELASAAFDRLLTDRAAAVLPVDTNIAPDVPGRRSAAEVEALIRRADVVLTSRLHGLVLALKHGVPALALDPVVGGAKVCAQARALGWPAARSVDAADDAWLAEQLDWCLGERGRASAAGTGRSGRAGAEQIRTELERALGRTGPFRKPHWMRGPSPRTG